MFQHTSSASDLSHSNPPLAMFSWPAAKWKFWSGSAAILMAAAVMGLSGCDRTPAPAPVSTTDVPADDDHDHEGHDHEDGHDHHDHHLGPNGGHFATLQPGDLKVEWVILDEGKELQVFVPETAADVTAVTMQVQLGEDELEPFELQPAEDLGNGAWRTTDPSLFNHVKMTADQDAGVKVQILAETDGEAGRATIVHHQH